MKPEQLRLPLEKRNILGHGRKLWILTRLCRTASPLARPYPFLGSVLQV